MSWPPKPKGSGGGQDVNFQLQNNSLVLVFDNQYQLPMGGWTTVPFNFMEGGSGFSFDSTAHTLTVVKAGPLSIVARVGVAPNLEETGRMRLTIMILKNGTPIGQDIDSALHYDVMCEAQAVAVEFFNAGDVIEIAVIADGVDWASPALMVQPDRSINSLQVACLTPEVII